MAIQNKISLETRFQLNNTPQNFRIQDTTDYSSEGIATSDVVGALKIIDPNGNIIQDTTLPLFDIDVDVQDYIDTILLPTDSNAEVLQGNYIVTYTIRVSGAVQPGDYESSFTYKFCYENINLDIDITVDLINAKLTSTDNTSYPQEVTASNRTHTVYPPNGLDPVEWPDQVVATKSNIYSKDENKIATKTWTSKVINVLELTYPDNLIVDVTVSGNTERNIKDDINICNLQCNMRALVDRYYKALGTDTVNADLIYKDQLAPSLAAAFMYTSNISCGNFDQAEKYYQDVLTFTGSQPDCQCSDSTEPQIITASGGGGGGINGTYVVEACNINNAITVTSSVVGETTTFTVCFSQSLFEKLNILTETNIISSDGSVEISTSTSGYNKEFDIAVNQDFTPPNIFSGIIDIQLNQASGAPVATWRSGWSTTEGLSLTEPTINIETPSTWEKFSNSFFLSDYFNDNQGKLVKPQFKIINTIVKFQRVSFEGLNYQGASRTVDVNIKGVDIATDRIYFDIQRYNEAYPPSGYSLRKEFDKISISVTINA